MKIWLITVKGTDERQRLRAFARKEDAVADMERIADNYEAQSRHAVVNFEKINDYLWAIAVYCEGGSERYEEAVMF